MRKSGKTINIVETVIADLADIINLKQIGKVYDLYQHNAVRHAPLGDHYGREAIIREYTLLLAAFPDLDQKSLNVVCVDDGAEGYKILEQFQWSGTNTGYSAFGDPTQKPVFITGLRVLRVRDGRILEEWIQDDGLSLIRQLGLEPVDAISRMTLYAAADFTMDFGLGEVTPVIGQTQPAPWPKIVGAKTEPDLLVQTFLSKVWNWRLLDAVDEIFAADCRFDLAGGVKAVSIDDFKAYLLDRMAAFSNLNMMLDDLFWASPPGETIKAAVRWTMIGTHDGPSRYGRPGNAGTCLPGVSFLKIKNSEIIEYTERFGEIALLLAAQNETHLVINDDLDEQGE